MAHDSSFDIVSEIDLQEVDNAVNQARQEVHTRFDFKGSQSKIEFERDSASLDLVSDDEFKLKSLVDLLQTKLVRRGVDLKVIVFGKVETAAGGLVRQKLTLVMGLDGDKAREITKLMRQSKLKVQAQIEGSKIRVSGKSRDELQKAIALVKDHDFDVPLQFTNYR